MATKAYLLFHDPEAGPTAIRLDRGQKATLGRASTNSIVIRDERASRCHAEVFAAAEGWRVRDLDSRNGTRVGGEPIKGERPLVAGDVIRIGKTEIVFGLGDPPTEAHDGSVALGSGMSTDQLPDVLQQWHASITHRRTETRLLDVIRAAAETAPRVGRAAAELCRLAFALGQAGDMRSVAELALATALEGCSSTRGVVFLPDAVGAAFAKGGATLEPVAMAPDPWPAAALPRAAVATVLRMNEAIVARESAQRPGSVSSMSAPIRADGHSVGVMHLEKAPGEREGTPDDLEFLLAVCNALGMAVANLQTREALSVRLATTADENARLKARLREESRMVGVSRALGTIVGQIGRVAGTKATVLVRGESGAGKELVARAIHEASDRRAGPFVCLNCAALSETLLESELFGHEKGAFTGATERKVGKFEQAHRGTIMLDEIGEMSPAIQAKFLRVLEGHPYERVGGQTRVQVDVRVVAATNRDLEKAVESGDFRRDLYFRLKVVEILVPPLRHRVEDIEPLARHFLGRFAAETGQPVRDFTPAALEAMRRHHWPGNIRELRNCIERAVVLSSEALIDVPELGFSDLGSSGDTGRVAPGPRYVPETLEEMERRHVVATLAATAGNKTKAAAILGIERSTLDRKLARWADGRPEPRPASGG
ncbi:MAG: FHA domain-containing protein [Planctomycetia bacterium]|nr:FHA domain-containing protein [Planctomycetia bacterium]